MNLPPKEFVVYWASKFAGNHKGYDTPLYKPNMMTFDNETSARTLYEKLNDLMAVGGTYRGRIVCHVANCF